MTKPFQSIAFAACIATIPSFWTPPAQAKQQCIDLMPLNSSAYWSWRLIDGRKCWYEGKPMLSKSALEWAAIASARPDSDEESKSVLTEKPNDPLDSNAWTPDSDSFEALWRSRASREEGSGRKLRRP